MKGNNKMADNLGSVDKENILYETLVLSEWTKDSDTATYKNSINSTPPKPAYLSLWDYLKKGSTNQFRLLEVEYSWHLAVSADGKVIAVLQENILEIRTAKDEYSSVVGKAYIPNDQFPKLRKLICSSDDSFVAVARDIGVVMVFNLFGCNIVTIETENTSNNVLQPVVGLFFLQPKFRSTKWSNELLIVYHSGNAKSKLLSSLDGQESDDNIKFSFCNYYPKGITSVVYDKNHFLVVAGAWSSSEHGITVWRVLNDYPFFKCTVDLDKFYASSRSIFKFLPSFSSQKIDPKIIFKMSISPDSKLLACLHFSGEISLWRLPVIKLYKRWYLEEQPLFNKHHPEIGEINQVERCFNPVDIGWWSTEALAIARKNGSLTVCSITTLNNILGDSPKFLSPSPQIKCFEEIRSGVIVLECEITFNSKKNISSEENQDNEASILQESIQAALYSFTDIERFEPKKKTPKMIQKTYRMLALKRTTPQELYARKIEFEEYEEALILAKLYNLDCDLVYQKRWRNSIASKADIHDYLEKVKKISWIINECIERVPEKLEDAKELIEFGLKKTRKQVSLNELSSESKQLAVARLQLLKFLDKLIIYEKIIEFPGNYNSENYAEFRKQSAIVAAVNFARQENGKAVCIMLTYTGNEILPHWLPILSNFPETLKVSTYRSLLPEIINNEVIPWKTQKLRELDWVEDSLWKSFCKVEINDESDILYKNNPHLLEFKSDLMTAELLEKWYTKRTYEIEKNTGLVENALLLVILAKERGIKTLGKLYCNLLTLDSLVYIVQEDSITLQKLEAMNHYEQCKLLLSKTSKSSFISDLNNLIVPFAKRCSSQGCHSSFALLQHLLLHFSEKSLALPLELLTYLKGGCPHPLNLSLSETVTIILDCIYCCLKSDQLENCYLILECLPQRSDSGDSEMHDRIDRLEIHLEVCEILDRYQSCKSLKFIHENENNEEVGKQIMNKMAEYTKRYTLDFAELLSDYQIIRSKIFPCIPEKYCNELCVLMQMTCECEEIILSTEAMLQCRKDEKNKSIPFDRSVELVLTAAQIHFEKATSGDDHFMKLAQTCLRLIGEPHSQICEELDLIEAVQLLRDLDVYILPLQVRKHSQRIKLIEACLKAKPMNYKLCQRLLQLAQTLRVFENNRTKREGEVLMLIAEYALNSHDYPYCSEICSRLMAKNFSPAWTIIKKLAEKDDYSNRDNKLMLLAFAILHSPIENSEELIEYRVKLRDKYFNLDLEK